MLNSRLPKCPFYSFDSFFSNLFNRAEQSTSAMRFYRLLKKCAMLSF